jgi:hypothetical protein
MIETVSYQKERLKDIPLKADNLMKELRDAGYTLEPTYQGSEMIKLTGRGIYGFLCKDTDTGMLYISHKDCFNKCSDSPIQIRLPKNKKETDFLFRQLTLFGSKEGYDLSGVFDILIGDY